MRSSLNLQQLHLVTTIITKMILNSIFFGYYVMYNYNQIIIEINLIQFINYFIINIEAKTIN